MDVESLFETSLPTTMTTQC